MTRIANDAVLYDLRNDTNCTDLAARGYTICCTEKDETEKNEGLLQQGYIPVIVEMWDERTTDEAYFYHRRLNRRKEPSELWA